MRHLTDRKRLNITQGVKTLHSSSKQHVNRQWDLAMVLLPGVLESLLPSETQTRPPPQKFHSRSYAASAAPLWWSSGQSCPGQRQADSAPSWNRSSHGARRVRWWHRKCLWCTTHALWLHQLQGELEDENTRKEQWPTQNQTPKNTDW